MASRAWRRRLPPATRAEASLSLTVRRPSVYALFHEPAALVVESDYSDWVSVNTSVSWLGHASGLVPGQLTMQQSLASWNPKCLWEAGDKQ